MNMIEIKNLKKKYPRFNLDIDSLLIPEGKIIGLIGENGAGKTTLIKSLLNIIKIDNGSIKIFDKDYTNEDIKNDIGIVLDNSFFTDNLRAKDISSILSSLYSSWDNDLFYSYLEKFDIPDNQIIKTLSKGMKKKLEIATALSHNSKLLILDEPTSGLDPVVRNDILDIFLELIDDNKHTILLSTHITSDLERVADIIVFIDKGKVVLQETRENIDKYGLLICDEKEFQKLDHKDYISYKKTKDKYEVLVYNKEACRKKYKSCTIKDANLDDIMLNIIRGGK
jgi:ABC-2 type transport system ATP-binding protein